MTGRRVLLFVFFNIAICYLAPCSALSATYYIAPNGSDTTGSGTSSHPWATFNQAYASMIGGDTLIAKNGTYLQQTLLGRWDDIRPPSGENGKYTTIMAESDGEVIVDSAGSTSPISLDGPPLHPIQYIQFVGIVFRRTTGSGLYQVDHLKFLRCGFEDAADGNNATFSMSYYVTNVLMEDCYAWGSGRYKFITYHSENIIFRRCLVRLDRAVPTHNGRSEPIGGFSIYASNNVELQNCISIDGDESDFWINPSGYCGAYCIPSTDGRCSNVTIRGSMSINIDMQSVGLTKNLENINFIDFVSWQSKKGLYARDSATFNHTTFGNITQSLPEDGGGATSGLLFYPGDDPVNSISVENSIIMNVQGDALTGFNLEEYNILFGNGTNYRDTWYKTIPRGTHTILDTDPQLTYLPRIETNNTILHGTGSNGSDRGANILKKIGRDGTLYGETGYNEVTEMALWPWPYESKIKEMLSSYSYTGLKKDGSTTGTLSGARGFAASGTGLYGGPITLTSYIWEYLGYTCPTTICNYGSQQVKPSSPVGLSIQ